MQHAERITLDPVAAPPTGCQTAARDGAADARERQGRAGWIVVGVLLPVIMPVLAHVLTPQPSAERMLAYGVDDARCYAASYSETAQRKRKTSAWIGLAAGGRAGPHAQRGALARLPSRVVTVLDCWRVPVPLVP